MSRSTRAALRIVVGLTLALHLTGPSHGQAERTPAQLWDDFNHYVLIARPDLAVGAGQALLNSADAATILDVVEASDFKDWQRVMEVAVRMEDVRDVASSLSQTIQGARIERSREQPRIEADIDLLSAGQRPFTQATERLRAAGQYAAPQLLATLMDDTRPTHHPFVLSSIVEIGRPLVYPLSVALPDLPPVAQQQVARALAEIGYPLALPYMKKVLENPATDPAAKQTVQSAFNILAAQVRTPTNVSAAELFYQLGMSQYTAAAGGDKPVGFDPATGKGLVWAYIGEGGLVPTPVPGEIFGDVLAMRDAQHALSLDPRMDKALSLWLMANLRRENRLPDGQTDPSYPAHLQPAAYYAMLAGPQRQHEVLHRALDDSDVALALDAIAALSSTAGPDALTSREGTVKPLIRALTYPDRRVRYSAAIALANARPKVAFTDSYRVVPVLAEAVRQTDVKYAVVVGRSGEDANSLRASVAELGYEVYADTTLDAMRSAIANLPGVDLIVVSGDADGVESMVRRTGSDYKLATVPVLAVVTVGDQIDLARRMGSDRRLSTTVAGDAAQLRSAIEQSSRSLAGEPITGDEAAIYATTAIAMLQLIALESKGVFNPMDAQPALIDALGDDRSDVAIGASGVLAMLDSSDAQKAVATAALAANAPAIQVPMLENLATSANTFGNRLDKAQLDRVLELVKTSDGEVALAAAQAHGALQLPTGNAVELLLARPAANGQ
jgi:hypothetical protein